MKKIFLAVATLIVLVLVSFTTIQNNDVKTITNQPTDVVNFDGTVAVDLDASVVLWKGFKPTGNHNGTVKLKFGSMKIEDGKVKSGKFVIDMTTIADIDESKRLEGHLKSADFFDVKKYPTSTFVITKAKKKDGKVIVTADLTIKGITKSIEIPTIVFEEGSTVVFKSETFLLNRADFNVKYGSKSFFDNLKDKFISDDMEMSFEVKGTK